MPRHTISKTSFLQYLACSGELWMQFNEPAGTSEPVSLDFLYKVEQGNLIDRLAQQWFANNWATPASAQLSFQKVAKTEEFYAKIDIAVWEEANNHIQLFEVKASTDIRTEHVFDLAFQKMVFEKAGFTVTETHLIYVNKEYLVTAHQDYQDLLRIEDITQKVNEQMPTVQKMADEALACINGAEPVASLLSLCGNKLNCPHIQKHHPQIPAYNVTKIARINQKKLELLLAENIIDIHDVPKDFPLSANQRLQVEVAQNQQIILQSKPIQQLLDGLTYPLYFLDYESFSYVLPVQEGFSPYQQMVFQYSLHTIAEPDGLVRHTEYLLQSKTEPLENLLEQMQQDMNSEGGTVIVWNKSFECSRNKEMAALYPQYTDFLLNMNNKVFDLMEIFSKNLYVHPDFKGKSSLKSVLPVLCPELSYQNLPIGDGMTATIKWHQATSKGLTDAERAQIFADLLRYCGLDTWAMVRIWEEVRKGVGY